MLNLFQFLKEPENLCISVKYKNQRAERNTFYKIDRSFSGG